MSLFFFFNDTATTEIYTLSLHDALPILAYALRGTPARAVSEEAMALLLAHRWPGNVRELMHVVQRAALLSGGEVIDRKSTRLNSSHQIISYAVFCLKKKKTPAVHGPAAT